jgi:putative ATP-binding cassette transporter
MIRFDVHLWQRFRAIAVPYWFREEKWPARGLLAPAGDVAAGADRRRRAVQSVDRGIHFGTGGKRRREVLECDQEVPRHPGVAVPIYAFYYFVRDKLGLHWRRWLTRRLLGSYFSKRAYYRLNASAEIDNPDQRIAEDIRTFTQESLHFLLVMVGRIAAARRLQRRSLVHFPEMVAFLVVYAIVGTAVTLLVFGQVLIGLNFYQLKREADFRFSLVRIRENAEAIAFYRGEHRSCGRSAGISMRYSAISATHQGATESEPFPVWLPIHDHHPAQCDHCRAGDFGGTGGWPGDPGDRRVRGDPQRADGDCR